MTLDLPDEPADWRTKGLLGGGDVIGASIFDGPFSWPVMTLRAPAVRHNVAELARFCTERGVLLAPHAKTTMAPFLLQLQLDAGAWGLTVATAHQAAVVRRLGATRLLLANELLDARALRWLAAELAADDSFDCLFYVDSPAGVAAAGAAAGPRAFRVLVELGRPGGRTGCRDVASVVDVARAAAQAGLEVAGVAGYEGGLPDEPSVAAYAGLLRESVLALHSAGLLHDPAPVVSAGGSAWFDVVADGLTTGWPAGLTVTPVLRSGAYIGHDDGYYADATPYASRLSGTGRLEPALRLWAQVVSAPEPGLVVAGFGKRDASFDLGLPSPLLVRTGTGAERPAAGTAVTKLDDQHAYITVGDDPPAVGDVMAFGLSHPCTAFDKWRILLLVDADDRVIDLVHTYF